MRDSLYPQSPEGLPNDFIKISKDYKTKVLYVLIGIILFILLFAALIFFSGYMVYWAIFYDMINVNKFTLLLKIGAIGSTIMFFLFTLKFLFKSNKYKNPTDVVLKKEEHPKLFDFIQQLCKETGAPLPKKVIVNEQINAAVFYDNPILSMFLPVRKNLLIGLGLVNSLNLSEFKAVLAHEFGHFAQRSMKLGSYVYMANRIIHDMVYNRDKWDETLDRWSESDFRIAIFAWILKLFVWIIRQLLALIYKGINLLHASLSRQMEFNADLVAVSVTGSDQIIKGLSKIMKSSQAMNLAFNQLKDAADHKLFTKDLFYHQSIAEEYLEKLTPSIKNDKKEDESRENQMLFSPDEVDVPDMYASHPSNYDREVNAKANYIVGITDERPAWVLFDQPEALKEKITKKIYKHSQVRIHKNDVYSSPEKVNEFIQRELEETTFGSKYCDTYDSRYIHPYLIEQAEAQIQENFNSVEKIRTSYEAQFNALPKQMEFRKKLLEELSVLYNLVAQRKKQYVYKGQNYTEQQIVALINERNEGVSKQYTTWFKAFDETLFYIHLAMLRGEEATIKEEYLERCQFQNSLLQFHLKVEEAIGILQQTVQEAIEKGNLTEKEVSHFERQLNKAHEIFSQMLEKAKNVLIPSLEHIETQNLEQFIFGERLIIAGQRILNDKWINNFSGQLESVKNKINRLYFKSLGKIIKLQESISQNYFERTTAIN